MAGKSMMMPGTVRRSCPSAQSMQQTCLNPLALPENWSNCKRYQHMLSSCPQGQINAKYAKEIMSCKKMNWASKYWTYKCPCSRLTTPTRDSTHVCLKPLIWKLTTWVQRTPSTFLKANAKTIDNCPTTFCCTALQYRLPHPTPRTVSWWHFSPHLPYTA